MKLVAILMHDSAPVETLIDRINAASVAISSEYSSAQVVHHYDKVGHRWVFVYYWA